MSTPAANANSPRAQALAAAAATPHPVAQNMPPPPQTTQQTSGTAARLWPWLIAGLQDITQTWGQNGETGVDLGLPLDTPITSLTAGRVAGAGYYGGGGVVSVHSLVMGKRRSVYYQHLDLIAPGIGPGSIVVPGQLIGWSGGQLSGGHHPSTPQFSTGPHLEVGLDAPYGGMWAPLGPNVDPLPWLQSLAAQGSVSGTSGVLGALLANQTAGHVPGFAGLAQSLDQACQFGGFNVLNPVGSVVGGLMAFFLRATVTIIGLGLVLLFAANVLRAVSRDIGPEVQQATQIAAMAAM